MSTATQIFEAERRRLTSLCYRMLGEVAAAEDAVQETWLRWADVDPNGVSNPAAWLRRVATNIAIDTLRSARAWRERYVGPWLPEPLIQSDTSDPPAYFELAQDCELALLWAMERLNERERAAFILREAFDASYAEIARALETTEAACRQLVSRSHTKLRETGPRFDARPEEVAAVSAKFFEAAMAQDFEAALALLTPQSVAISDGGANRRAARRPLIGGPEILQVFRALHDKVRVQPGWQLRPVTANGRPALGQYIFDQLDSVIAMAPDQKGRIGWIYVMVNPEKLTWGKGRGNQPKTPESIAAR